VNTNFNDLIASLTDSSKSLSIDALTLAGEVGSDLNPDTAATYDLGSATNSWLKLHLDNGATDGGAIYFDAGATEYIKANAAGTQLNIDGFTTVELADATAVDFTSAATVTLAATSAIDTVTALTLPQCTAFNIGDGTDANVTATINADSGDAKLRLQVNNASANAWDIYNDNSSNDVLTFDYNGTSVFAISTTGGISLSGPTSSDLSIIAAGAGDASLRLRNNNAAANTWVINNDNDDSDHLKFEYGGSSAQIIAMSNGGLYVSRLSVATDDATAPAANYLYKANVPKAWARIDLGAAGAVTIDDDHNVSSASYAAADLDINWDTDFANVTYVCNAMPNASTVYSFTVFDSTNVAVGTLELNQIKHDGTVPNWSAAQELMITATGDQ